MAITPMLEEKEELQQELLRMARASKFKKKLISTAVMLVIILATIAGSWLSGRSQAKKSLEAEMERLLLIIKDYEDNPIVINPVSPEISLQKIYSEIKSIGELATTEYLFTDAGKFTDSKQIKDWNIPFTEKSFILKWSGVIKAGIDLEKVSIDINELEKKIIVSLPDAEILSYETDMSSTEVLDEQNNLFNPVTVSDKLSFDEKTQEAIIERAKENGILEKAQQNAEDVLLRLLSFDPAIGDSYTIEFVTASN